MHLTLACLAVGFLAKAVAQDIPDEFPALAENDRPECAACLTDLLDDTCDGASGEDLHHCLCGGEGAFKFRDECLTSCCSGTMACIQEPYKDWWTSCVDDYPQWCHDPPNKIVGGIETDLWREHCSEGEISSAEELAAATSTAPYCESTDALANFNRDCITPTGDEAEEDEEDAAAALDMNPFLGVIVAVAAGWLY